MRIAICDDDKDFVIQLEQWIKEYFKKNKMNTPETTVFYCGEDLLADKGFIDIAFLDVEMPGVSGICAGRDIMEKNPDVLIFIVTGYADYLDEALRYNAFRYLTKPLDKQRLYRNLSDAVKIYTTCNTKIAIETKKETYIVRAPDIISFEAAGHKLYVHTIAGDYIAVHNMQYWEEHLNMKYFFRTHRSYIVNMEHIIRYDHSLIYMDDSSTVYLTRRKYKEFCQAYMMYLEGAKE